jgi:Bacterial Tetracyclin repressor,  C-terminal domain
VRRAIKSAFFRRLQARLWLLICRRCSDQLLDSFTATVLANRDDLDAGLRAGLDIVFDALDEPLIQAALTGGGIGSEQLIPLVRAANEQATTRIADLLYELRPTMSVQDAIIFGDSLARIALTHAIAPTASRQQATDRLIRITLTYLAAEGV